MSAMMPWAVETLIASTLLMVLVLVLRKPVRRAFGPGIAYALWALPALRLLLPPLPHEWREQIAAPVARASQQIVILVAQPAGEAVAAPAQQAPLFSPWLGLVPVALWAAGAAVFILWHTVAHARFCRRLLATREGEAVRDDGVRVIASAAATGPLAFGVWRRYVAFPQDFVERYDADERDLALAHELGHHARGDLIANWIALVVLALHWFNPVAWRAFRLFRVDQEMANDARVLAGRDAVTRHLYACAIVKAAHGGAISAACHLHTIEDLKGRLTMLTTSRPSRGRRWGGASAIAAVTLAGLGFTASGTQAAERVRAHVEKATGVDLSHIALPAAFQSATTTTSTTTTTVDTAAPATGPAPLRKRVRVLVNRDTGGVIETREDLAPPAPLAPLADGTYPPAPPSPPPPSRVVVRVKDGPLTNPDWSPNVPQVSSGNCPGSANHPTVIHDRKDGRKIIVICTNRIERMAQRGQEAAMARVDERQIERDAYAKALVGLRANRARMAASMAANSEGRAEALDSMDDAIRQLESEMARAN